MKVKAKVNQPSPDEIINDFFSTRDPAQFFVNGDISCLTDDGKAILAIGIKVFSSFEKHKR